ncbi:NAD(P)/FAD-dependent oxidoreductase [Bombilactobacillus bombi]|uniref:NAD(P)/FAD-dependent oxidoreductase n=1 Tax=Bombilactobacillus bombi TaxID=1303590 RepID=UPI0015E5B4B8|nr:tryptophan 7-halogenase [Bombilactobacillus bombi]MBA1435219.1 FAD-binding protein [Bombilactobacillus bombi]
MENRFDVIVIGGGPAGSMISTLLQRKGWEVALFEKEQFPRYHIGESLVPGCVPILQKLGVFKDIERVGFQKKYGITFVWGDQPNPWHVRWDETPSEITKNYTFV